MKRLIILLLISLTGASCFSTHRHRYPIPAAFAGTRWTVLYGKTHDSVVNFCKSPENCYEISFTTRRFRGSDGSFYIRGMAKDTSSLYYNRFSYSGFYDMEGENKVRLYWFSMVVWGMHFERNKMSRAIGWTFSFDGMYEEHDGNLFFYTQDSATMKKDTVIMMKFIRKETNR